MFFVNGDLFNCIVVLWGVVLCVIDIVEYFCVIYFDFFVNNFNFNWFGVFCIVFVVIWYGEVILIVCFFFFEIDDVIVDLEVDVIIIICVVNCICVGFLNGCWVG